MKNTKTVDILKTFTVKELKEFEKLISSPFFSTGRNLLPFFKAVKRFYPGFNDDKFTDEYIFRILYAGKAFKKVIIRKLNSDLMKLALEFLKQISLRNNPVQEKMITSKACQARKLYTISKKLIAESESYLDSQKISSFYYHRKELITSEKQGYIYNNGKLNDTMKQTHNSNEIITSKFIYLSTFGYTNMLQYKNAYNCEIEHDILFTFINYLDIHGLIKKLESMNYNSDKLTLINLYLMISWKHMENDKYFKRLKELIYLHYEMFDWDLKNTLFLLLKYLVTLKGSLHNFANYKRELFEINKFILKKKIHINEIHKCFHKKEFANHFLSGYTLGEYKWAENFIKKYSKDMSERDRPDGVNYCKAYLAFAKKDHDSCLFHLNSLNARDDYEKLAMYYFKTAVYYEKGFYEDVLTTLEVYYKFLNRENYIIKDKIHFHFNFINIVKGLVNIKLDSGKTDKHELMNSFKSYNNKIAMLNWVEKCISEI